MFWGPLLMTAVLALTGLALVVHRQWSVHEQIPYPIVTFAQSILPERGHLVGWAIKTIVVRYGGGKLYATLKPLMIGLIAGEMLSGGVTMLIGAIYYVLNNEPPKPYIILGA